MATKKQLYRKPIRGYWENRQTGHVYMLYEGSAEDNSRGERIHWNAGALNLRTGRTRRLRLKDFDNLFPISEGTCALFESNIDILYFMESYRNAQTSRKCTESRETATQKMHRFMKSGGEYL